MGFAPSGVGLLHGLGGDSRVVDGEQFIHFGFEQLVIAALISGGAQTRHRLQKQPDRVTDLGGERS